MMNDFAATLVAWYDQAKRPLPWRETQDPYAILVSELMLQQTQVKTVIPYYHRFLARFPKAEDLAAASEEDLLKMWQGLGYYRRARHLQAAAQQIVESHGGVFPRTKTEIDALKGVGVYTSAAVSSIAFNLPHACVDGNVIRVISRLHGIDDEVGQTAVKRRLQLDAQALLHEERPGDHNQAMMELGATICTPRNPSCLTCPVRTFCTTHKQGDDPHARPVKAKRVQPSKIAFESLFLYSGDHLLLARRPDQGLMAGMWELPSQVFEEYRSWPDLFHGELQHHGALGEPIMHRFTHLHATYHVKVYESADQLDWVKPPNAYAETRWVGESAFETLPMTKVLHKTLPLLTEFLRGRQACRISESRLPGM